MRSQFLDFVSSCPSLPPGGLASLGIQVAESGRAFGRAELLAKRGGIWAQAASAGTGTDP